MGILDYPMANDTILLHSTDIIVLSAPWFSSIAHHSTSLLDRHAHDFFNDLTSQSERKPKDDGLFNVLVNDFSACIYAQTVSITDVFKYVGDIYPNFYHSWYPEMQSKEQWQMLLVQDEKCPCFKEVKEEKEDLNYVQRLNIPNVSLVTP